MSQLPQIIVDEWSKRVKAPVFTTVDDQGMPNSIYATCVSFYENEKILIANNYFDKTLVNLQSGCKGNLLFLTEEGKAYQLKGVCTHYSEGIYFEDMKNWNPERLPGVGVAVIEVEAIYSGSKKIEF